MLTAWFGMRSQARSVLLVHLLLVGWILATCTAIVVLAPDMARQDYILSTAFVVLVLWCFFSWRRVGGEYLHPYSLILLATILFNGGHMILQVLYPGESIILKGPNRLCRHFEDPIMTQAMLLVIASVGTLHLGALWGEVRGLERKGLRDGIDSGYSDGDVRTVGWCLLAMSLMPTAILQRQALEVVMTGGYLETFMYGSQVEMGGLYRILRQYFVVGAFFLLAGGSERRRLSLIVAVLAILSTSVVEFFVGDRSKGVMPILMLMWIYHKRVQRIRGWHVVLAGALLLFIVFPVVQVARDVPGAERSFSEIGERIYSLGNPISFIIWSMGSTLGHITQTMDLVPHTVGYGLGDSYLRGLSGILPNVVWATHPASQPLGGDWYILTLMSQSERERGLGVGYSFIAEAYYNFGLAGSVLIMLVAGYFFARLVCWGERGGGARVAAVASVFSFGLLVPRGFLFSMVRPLVWYGLLPYAIVFLVGCYRRGHLRLPRGRSEAFGHG